MRGDGQPIALEPAAVRGETAIELRTRGGEVKLVPEPAGTRGGYDDLRRAASREPLGRGLRPLVASIGDLARMAAALGREQDLTRYASSGSSPTSTAAESAGSSAEASSFTHRTSHYQGLIASETQMHY